MARARPMGDLMPQLVLYFSESPGIFFNPKASARRLPSCQSLYSLVDEFIEGFLCYFSAFNSEGAFKSLSAFAVFEIKRAIEKLRCQGFNDRFWGAPSG